MAGSFLRLDLDSSGIKAQIIEHSNTQAFIKGECHVRYESLLDTSDPGDLFDAGMDRVAQQIDIGTCSTAVIFVPSFSVSFRNIDLPFRSEKKIKQILPFELETVLPYSNRAYVSDFHSLTLENNSTHILTASLLESDIETYFSTLGRHSIKPAIITHKGYAAAVDFLNHHPDISNYIFLHISGSAHTLVLIKDKKPCLVRTFNALQDDPEGLAVSIKQTLIGFQQRTMTDIGFDLFISSGEDRQGIQHIYGASEGLMGDPPRIEPAIQDIPPSIKQDESDESFSLPSVIPDKKIKYLFNFCKGKFGSSSFLETYFRQILIVFILAFFAFILSITSIKMDISHLESKIAFLDTKAVSIFKSTFPEKKKIQDPFLQMKADVQAAIQTAVTPGGDSQSISNKNITIVNILRELSGKIAASTDMEISNFFFNNRRLVLSGSTNNFNTVDTIKSRIESADLFEKVSISSAAADKKGDRVNFKFIIEM